MSPLNSMTEREPPAVSRILCYLLFGLLAYAAWVRGGVYTPWQWPLLTFSVLLLGGIAFSAPEHRARITSNLLHDPVLYLGLVFLLILIVQGVNSGYIVVWNRVDQVGMSDLPPRWLPWSVEPRSASEMLVWFFPAWAALLVVRHGIGRSDLMLLLYLMVWNAALLAIVAIIQQMVQPERMLGLWKISPSVFFGTFGYSNHAGAWFYLHAAVAAGLTHRAIRRRQPGIQVGVWGGCFLLCLTASFMTLSRAAALASVLLVVLVFCVLLVEAARRVQGNQWINVAGLTCIVVLLGAVLYFGAGGGSLAQEVDETFLGPELAQTVEGRTMQLPSAFDIAADYPLFGCGGWGYRWVALLHIPVEDWPKWQHAAGKANVHCDPLQFLVEFGAVGSLLMAAVVVYLMVQAVQCKTSRSLRNWIGVGLLLVFLHSFVDLPYRCPAILIAWCSLLAALTRPLETRAGEVGMME